MTMIRQRGESKQRVIVVLEGSKVSAEKTGIAPLWRAARDVNNEGDEILVLTLLNVEEAFGSSSDTDQLSENNSHINFVRQEIDQKKAFYRQIFRPFYDNCKRNGVKFQVKIAAGFWPKDIIINEANNANATWILMDRCITRELSFQLSGIECNISLVGDDDEAIVNDFSLSYDECSFVIEERLTPKFLKLMNGSLLRQESCSDLLQPSSPSLWGKTTRESETEIISEHEENEILENLDPSKEEIVTRFDIPISFSKANIILGVPLQLSWEVMMEITAGFSTRCCAGQSKNYTAYLGYLTARHSFVLVKRFTENSSSIFEAEKKTASSIHHKNILELLGYHQSDRATILVYPLANGGSLDDILYGRVEEKLKLRFQEKLKIAIGIAQGVRYMHEESPRGPIVHGELQLGNIFLRNDLEPMISGFGQSTWIHLEQPLSMWCEFEDPVKSASMKLLKSDVFSFGVLLLRLFCRRCIPMDDKSLIELARPLIQERKFHELLEDDLEVSDLHGLYRVMAAAIQCTRKEATSRPCMSEVISILEGKTYSTIQPSPAYGSP